jgi:hypothetical protein
MRTLTVFNVRGNTDTTEGRGNSIVLARANSEQLAQRIANTESFYGEHGVMGGPNLSVQEESVKVFETYEDFLIENNNSKVNAALRKLTKEEKKLLGLS